MEYWKFKGKELKTLDDIKSISSNAIGFVYHLTLVNKKTGDVDYYYIGKKNLYTTRKRHFGKKEVSATKDKRKKTYEYVIKESDWKKYMSSNKFIKNNLDKYDIQRDVISFSDTDAILSYQEAKEIICQDALYSPMYLNDAVSIRRYSIKRED